MANFYCEHCGSKSVTAAGLLDREYNLLCANPVGHDRMRDINGGYWV